MFEDLKGKVALVTGGASGMGRATAVKLAAMGVKVVITAAHNVKGGEEAAAEIKAAGGEAVFMQADVSKEEDVKALVERTVSEYGSLDLAFNNAGIGPDGVRIPFAPLTDFSVKDFDDIIATNLRGVFLCLKYELIQMKKQGRGGAIVNTSSVGGIRMVPGFGAYGPSKAGVNAITQTAALESGGDGIRVNVICPGPTLGTILMDNNLSASPPDAMEHMNQIIPLHKTGTVEDVANACVFLLSSASGHTTGQVFSVDGGMHAM
jgi:NAD(P)-dependent dehydrogenase (short-subunit alcohol dehydrogenase family)